LRKLGLIVARLSAERFHSGKHLCKGCRLSLLGMIELVGDPLDQSA